MSIRLADRSLHKPLGIVENVIVRVGNFLYPVDFVILEMDEDKRVPLILGRPFLNTADAIIKVKEKEISLGMGDERVKFSLNNEINTPFCFDESCSNIETVYYDNSLVQHDDLTGFDELKVFEDAIINDPLETRSEGKIRKEWASKLEEYAKEEFNPDKDLKELERLIGDSDGKKIRKVCVINTVETSDRPLSAMEIIEQLIKGEIKIEPNEGPIFEDQEVVGSSFSISEYNYLGDYEPIIMGDGLEEYEAGIKVDNNQELGLNNEDDWNMLTTDGDDIWVDYMPDVTSIPINGTLDNWDLNEDMGDDWDEIFEEVPQVVLMEQPTSESGMMMLPCLITTENFHGLVDTGASINVMPLSLYNRLHLNPIKNSNMVLELATNVTSPAVGVVEGVLVKIFDFEFNSEFVIVDMPENPNRPIILGRPFLKNARALIDLGEDTITIKSGFKSIIFSQRNQLLHNPNGAPLYKIQVCGNGFETKVQGENERVSHTPFMMKR